MSETIEREEDEISIFDLINPLCVQWKLWVGCACVGLLIGLAVWLSKGFEAELIARPVRKLEFVQWRTLSSGLPVLAENLGSVQGVSPEKKSLLDLVSGVGWWQKNLVAVSFYSKSDLKDLVLNDKALESNAISSLVIKAPGDSKEEAVRAAYGIEEFIRDGGAYLAIKNILNQYEADSLDINKKLQASISKDGVELAYLNKRAESIELLQKKYPDNEKLASQSFLDPKDNAAKYLPLGTQLIAVKTEINAVEESLSRWRDRLDQQQVIQQFMAKALPLLKTEASGLSLLAKLVEVENEMRRSTDFSNKQQILALDEIAVKIAEVGAGYSQLFEGSSLASARRVSKAPLALGFVAGLLVGVMWVFISAAYRRRKQTV